MLEGQIMRRLETHDLLEPAGKAELLSAWFDSKESRNIWLGCRRPDILDRHSVGFTSDRVRLSCTPINLDPNGGVDPSSCFF